jgi:hypothetical protein
MLTFGFAQKGRGMIQSTLVSPDSNNLVVLNYITNDKFINDSLLSLVNNSSNLPTLTRQVALRILAYSRRVVNQALSEGICEKVGEIKGEGVNGVEVTCNTYIFNYVYSSPLQLYKYTLHYSNDETPIQHTLELHVTRDEVPSGEEKVTQLFGRLQKYVEEMEKLA